MSLLSTPVTGYLLRLERYSLENGIEKKHQNLLDLFIYICGRVWKNCGLMHFCVVYVIQEMIEALRESVVHILHTRDGARVAMQCVWHGTAKVGQYDC